MLKSFQAISIGYSFSEIIVGDWEFLSGSPCKFSSQLNQFLHLVLYESAELVVIQFSIIFFHSIQFWCKYKETGRLSQAAQPIQLLSYETKSITNIKNPPDFHKQGGKKNTITSITKTNANIPILFDKTMAKVLKFGAILEVYSNNTIKFYKVLQM